MTKTEGDILPIALLDLLLVGQALCKGIKRIAQKVGEEGVETALAATVKDLEELKNESADLLYHLIVLLQASELNLSDVIHVLKDRHSK